MLVQLSAKKELNKARLDELIKASEEQVEQYQYIVGIFYQQQVSRSFIFNLLFEKDICSEIVSKEKTLLAYRSEKQGHENVIFLFSDTQYTDEDFNQIDRAIIDISDVIIGLDYTSQDSYHSMEQHLKRIQRDKEASLISKKDIHYLYPIDQDLADIEANMNSLEGGFIQRYLSIQEENDILSSTALKIRELEKYDIVPLPTQKLTSFFTLVWESLLSAQQKGTHWQLKQIIVGCHFEEQWELLINVLEKRTNEYRKECLSGEIHDFNKQQEEFNEIANEWKQSSIFLRALLPVLQVHPTLSEQIKEAIQIQTFKIFNFQLSNIHNNLTTIFYQKLTELQNQEALNNNNKTNSNNAAPIGANSSMTMLRHSTSLTSQQQLTSVQVPQRNSVPAKLISQQNQPNSPQLPQNLNSPIINNNSISVNENESSQSSKVPSPPPGDISSDQQLDPVLTQPAEISPAINAQPAEQENSLNQSDIHNHTFGQYAGVADPLKEAEESDESEDGNSSQNMLKRVDSIKEESDSSLSMSQIQQSSTGGSGFSSRLFTSQVTNRMSTKGASSVEMSTKIPGRLSMQLTSQDNSNPQGRRSSKQGVSGQPAQQEQVNLYEIMKKTKLRVLSELKTKMIQMLNATAKEELGIDAEMDSIEEQINEIIIKALKKRAELEVSELVQQRILAILRADVSKLFKEKDLDFWLKFKGVKNKIMGEWIPKIERFLKDRFNFSQKHSNELLVEAQDTIHEEVKSLIKVKMGDIVASFIQDLNENEKIKQGKEDDKKIHQQYQEFVLEVKNGRTDNFEQEILTDNEFGQILADLDLLLQIHKNQAKLQYYSFKFNIEKMIMHRRKTFFSLNPYLRWNTVTLTFLLIVTLLWIKESLSIENSLFIVLTSHVIYTFLKS